MSLSVLALRLVARWPCRPVPSVAASSPCRSLQLLLAPIRARLIQYNAPNRAYTVGSVPLASRIMMGMDGFCFFIVG
jgi:hypothetical protein